MRSACREPECPCYPLGCDENCECRMRHVRADQRGGVNPWRLALETLLAALALFLAYLVTQVIGCLAGAR